ncbi:MAG: hypothetical protein SFV51_27375 [Bryobacteraceae bacterium]|nr:hypothetical protein [Bryobacteraceae bacterium]
MTVTLHFPPDVEAGIVAQANAQGLPIDRYLQSIIEQSVGTPETWPLTAPTKMTVDDIPVFSVGRPMPVEMIQDTIDAVRTERTTDLSRRP